jgi:ankyrin repeat protein
VIVRFNQSPELLVDQPRDFWPDLEDQTLPFRSNWEAEFEWQLCDMPIYASAIRPIAERSLEKMRSIFGLTLPSTAESSSANYHLMMPSFLSQLEIDIPDFPTEQFRENWVMLPRSSHAGTVLNFLEYAVYLSSNNMLTADQTNAVLQWLVSSGNRPALDALVSSRLPTAQACIHDVFRCALKNGYLQVARTLVDANIDFSEVFQSSQRILIEALQMSDVELTQFLLQGGVDVSLCTNTLHGTKSVEIARLLLQAGIDVNELSNLRGFASTALGNAIINRNFKLAEFLIKEGADVNLAEKTEYYGIRTPLRAAIQIGEIRFMELLLDEGAELDAPSCAWDEFCDDNNLESYRERWASPLQVAAARGDIKLATHLLHAGADANAPSYEMSALHWAVKSGSIEMVRLLLAHSADPNTRANNDYKSTAIQIAVEQGDTDTIQILLDAGATIDNSADMCPLRGHLRQAIRGGRIDRARAILQLGINVSKPFSDRSTMIQEAIVKDDVGMVQLLVEAGADVNISCRSIRFPESTVTPLELTLEFMNGEVGHITLERGTNRENSVKKWCKSQPAM